MGCRVSKNDGVDVISDADEDDGNNRYAKMSPGAANVTASTTAAANKAKLERQMCLAKETPEPDFDLSDCAIKTVPSGVFILCRVLRKENLNLARNQLQNLDGGGDILDLNLLRILDIRQNLFKQLPSDVCRLINLRVRPYIYNSRFSFVSTI